LSMDTRLRVFLNMHLNQPRFGEVHVTSESNHAAYANIMIGVKVNRYPANYGFLCSKNTEYEIHLTEKKKGDMLFILDQDFKNELKDIGQIIPLTVGLMINVIAPIQVLSVLAKTVKTVSLIFFGVSFFLVVLTQYKLLSVFGLKAFLGMSIMFSNTAFIPCLGG